MEGKSASAKPGREVAPHSVDPVLEYSKPEVIGRKLDAQKQKAFIEAYEKLLNSLGPDEAVLSWTPCIRRMRASHRLLGAGQGKSRHRTNERATTSQRSRRT